VGCTKNLNWPGNTGTFSEREVHLPPHPSGFFLFCRFREGVFFGLFCRGRIAVLFHEAVERPSDVAGHAYIPLDAAGAWKGKLVSEINAAVIKVDWTALARM